MTGRLRAGAPFLLSLGMSLASTWLTRRVRAGRGAGARVAGRGRRTRAAGANDRRAQGKRTLTTAAPAQPAVAAVAVASTPLTATSAVGASTAVASASAPSLAALGGGLGAAVAAFTATFRGPRERFWQRMTLTGLGLGGYALLASAPARRTRIGPRDVGLGLGSAGALYLTFKVGDGFARRFVPAGDDQIRDIYALRTLRPRQEIALRLATIIGPAEELFWRGLVQEALMRRFGRWPGAALAAGSYGGVHLVTGNFTLFGAAGIAGAHWCALYAAGVPLGALVVSHVTWDVWIFLVQPTGATEPLGA
jgi:membrane protease YdiL (CAAX protease family)